MTPRSASLRHATSVILAVSFVAMATSGVWMLLAHGFGDQARLHPVHNVFGVIMVASGVAHVAQNGRALLAHLRPRWPRVLGLVLAGVMALLFAEGLSRALDAEAVQKIEDLLSAAHEAHHPR